MPRVSVVTGGTRGIGEHISIGLKEVGYKVAATYGSNDDAAKKFNEATGIPTYKFDASNYEACKENIAKIEADLGPVEILINNAGITRDAPFHRMTYEQWHEVIEVNLDSMFNMTRLVWEGMRSRNFGRIINMSSMNGQKGQFGQTNYAAAKAAILGFTKSLAAEGAAKGITVNAICPGYIATEMVKAVPEEIMKTKILPLIPIGRLGEPSEIAKCVIFLAADEEGYITGSTLTINGGQYMI